MYFLTRRSFHHETWNMKHETNQYSHEHYIKQGNILLDLEDCLKCRSFLIDQPTKIHQKPIMS